MVLIATDRLQRQTNTVVLSTATKIKIIVSLNLEL